MKKVFLAVMASIAFCFTLNAFAAEENDFSYGKTADGYYCYSQSCQIVYSKDASLIGAYEHRASLGSSQWYVKKNNMTMSSSYYNRIKAMELLRTK